MKKRTRTTVLLATALAVSVSACATETTTTTTWTAGAPGGWYQRQGQVESVQEVVRRTQGNPAGGAIAGALIGATLFRGHGAAALAGAAGGAAIGAHASEGGSETRTYNLYVRFDDGGYGAFTFAGYAPFRPGERVVLTPQGLARG